MTKRQRAQPFRVAPAEKEDLYLAAFAEGRSIQEMAVDFKRDRNTIARALKTPEALKRKNEILDAIGPEARAKLARSAKRAAESWVKQLELVDDGQRGNHLVARDLLTHTGVLDVAAPKKDTADHIVIQIGGVSLDDLVDVEAPESSPRTPRQVKVLPPGDDVTLPDQ